MSKSLKSELLKQAVRENVTTADQRLRQIQSSHQQSNDALSRRRTKTVSRAAVLLIGLAAAIVAAVAIRQIDFGSERIATHRVSELSASSSDASTAVPQNAPSKIEALEELTFPAPEPIDSTVFPLSVKKIMIDPGHGGYDHGTTANDLREKDLTMDISIRLRDLLQKGGFQAELTRTDDTAISLRERAQKANQSHADLFISIHVNWMSLASIRGVETYYLGATDDPELKERARRENQGSGYSLADLRQLLESIYTDVRTDESRQLAARIQRSLFKSLREINPGLRNRGVKSAPFVVLVATDMPAILAEVSCLSNKDEAELLARPLYREHIAESLYRGISGYVEDVKQSEMKES